MPGTLPLSTRARRLIEACDVLFPEMPSHGRSIAHMECDKSRDAPPALKPAVADVALVDSRERPAPIFSTAVPFDSRSPGREGE